MPTTEVDTPVKVKVDLDGEVSDIECRPGETLLEAALREGLDAPYSCMAGVCTTCKGKLTSGKVEMEVNDALTDEEVADGEVLCCQAKPTSTEDIQVKFLETW